MKKYTIAVIVIIGIILILFSSYYIYSTTDSNNDISKLKSKVDTEISYLNSTIVSMMNRLNNITYANYKIVENQAATEEKTEGNNSPEGEQGSSQNQNPGGGSQSQSQGESSNTITNINLEDNGILIITDTKIEWDTIKKEVEQMYGTWTTILIDLNALNVNRDNLLKYTSTLDNVTQAVEKEDKKTTLTEFANLYRLLVDYTQDYSDDDKIKKVYETKSNILYAYSLVEDENWNEMKVSIQNAQNAFSNIMNQELQNTNDIHNINKAYVLLNELQNCIDKKDKNIFYINYKNLMQELEIMEN